MFDTDNVTASDLNDIIAQKLREPEEEQSDEELLEELREDIPDEFDMNQAIRDNEFDSLNHARQFMRDTERNFQDGTRRVVPEQQQRVEEFVDYDGSRRFRAVPDDPWHRGLPNRITPRRDHLRDGARRGTTDYQIDWYENG